LSLEQAIAHLRNGRAQDAAPLIAEHLEQHPQDAHAWFLLGAVQHALNDPAKAARAFAHSTELDPSNLEAHLACAAVLRELKDTRAARAACERGLTSFPGEPRLHCAMALALEDAGLPDVALAQYELAIAAARDFEEAHHNRSLLLASRGRFEEAEHSYRSYIAARPASPNARSGLADVLLALGRYQDAMEMLDWILERSPRDIAALIRRGVALAALRRFAEAREAFDTARACDLPAVERYVRKIAPGSDLDAMLSPENIFLWRRYVAQGLCEWSNWSGYIAEFRRAIADPGIVIEPALAFVAFHLPLAGGERHAAARKVAGFVETRSPLLPPAAARRGARIRIGILSPDFREHLNAYLFLPLFELLDRACFELHAYSLGADDGSAIGAGLRKSADKFSDLSAMSDAQAASKIRSDAIDILIDAAGHTTGARFGITARRPAPLQALYLAFAGSLGSRRVDYAIVDHIVAPSSPADEWSEALVYLPDTYYLYDFRTATAEIPVSRRTYGLPDDAFVYCAFHKPEKITPDSFDLWMRILGRVPGSILWFLALSPPAAANLRAAARARGIDPARLHFAPFDSRERYLARQRLGDLMLDAVDHNAMTTACDALGAGLPVLTLRGSSMASRAGQSLLQSAGLPELVAADRTSFEEHAVHLALKPEALRALKVRLEDRRRNCAPLFNTAARVRQLEQAFQRMYAGALRGEAPASFGIAET
jgi:protein O-GlcNAc transferase